MVAPSFNQLTTAYQHEEAGFTVKFIQSDDFASTGYSGEFTYYNPSLVHNGKDILVFLRKELPDDEFDTQTNIGHMHHSRIHLQGESFPFQDTAPQVLPNGDLLYMGVSVRGLAHGSYKTMLIEPSESTILAEGPLNLKGIRIAARSGGTIDVVVRERSEENGRVISKIHLITVQHISELTTEKVKDALSDESNVIITFSEDDWGGINSLIELIDEDGNTSLGFIGHVACYDQDRNKLYAVIAGEIVDGKVQSMHMILDEETVTQALPPHIRSQLARSKRAFREGEVEHVIYPGTPLFSEEGTMYLPIGHRDMYALFIRLPYPFSKPVNLGNHANHKFFVSKDSPLFQEIENFFFPTAQSDLL